MTAADTIPRPSRHIDAVLDLIDNLTLETEANSMATIETRGTYRATICKHCGETAAQHCPGCLACSEQDCPIWCERGEDPCHDSAPRRTRVRDEVSA